MVQQVVTITPNTPTSVEAVMTHVADLLPDSVIEHMNQSLTDGTRTTTVTTSGDSVIVTTDWNDSAAATYVSLMASVSAGVKAALDSDGWTYNFSPETADL